MRRSLPARLLSGTLLLGLTVLLGTLRCAESTSPWTEEDLVRQRDGSADGGEQDWRCFMGMPKLEAELLDRCTSAERIDRMSLIPPKTWDPKTPLPEL